MSPSVPRRLVSLPRFVSILCLFSVLAVLGLFPGVARADEGSNAAKNADAKAPPSLDDVVGDLEAKDGLFRLYPDPRRGKLFVELPSPPEDGDEVARVIYYEGLLTGLGSNPVGLDRGQLGDSAVLSIRRLGDRVLFELPNLRFRADTKRSIERRATRHSFAGSVLWAARVAALDEDGTALVDLAPFLLRDLHGVVATLRQTDQGGYALDAERSAVDFAQVHAFPDNVEFESVLTYGLTGDEPGGQVAATAPRGDAFSLVQHVSFVRLPDDDYRPRAADPRIGMLHLEYADYAAPLDERLEKRPIIRHRLEKTDPTAESSPVVEPIVYYVDPGAPEPVRSALVEGASWWAEAFDAAGFEDAFRVEILPEDAHPLDVRYNVIQWVHRSTRGWSYGGGVIDPRTGEMLKGHVTLGSLRVRQDRLLFEGLLGTEKTGTGAADDPVELALARIRQLSAHEVGHTIGITHNFAASTYAERASVMDYPAPFVTLDADGEIDASRAYGVGVGAWDVHTIRWGYSQFPPDNDESAALDAIVREGLEKNWLFLTDADARPPGASDPRGNLWDNGLREEGTDAVDMLETTLAVRRHALDRFGEHNIRPGVPITHLHEVLVPVYLHHRYQLEAAAKTLGGLEYHFALRGDGQTPTRVVDAERQRRALDVMLRLLDPAELDLDEDVLGLLAPRPFGIERNREMFGSSIEPAFDPRHAARVVVNQVLDGLLQPQRLARVADFHRRSAELGQGDLPSVPEVLTAIGDVAFPGAAEDTPRQRGLREEVQDAVVDRLVRLAADPALGVEVRAPIVAFLADVVPTRLGEDDHGRELARRVERFLARPFAGAEPPPPPAPAPPGSPIGSNLGGCSGPDFLPAARASR